jgi:acetylxylan esterase
MYPGYTGARPRFQVYHGSADTTQNYQETVKEWTGVFGYDATKPAKSQQNFPLNGYKTDTWGVSTANPLGTVQGIYAQNVGHTVPIQGYVGFLMCITWWNNADSLDNSAQDMKWFGLA